MLDTSNLNPPSIIKDMQEATQAIGFTMASDLRTGSLLRTLVATRLNATVLELGTGTGIASAWLLDGMDANSRLLTVDRDERAPAIARRFLGTDPRITFKTMDGATFIEEAHEQGKTFDFIFADMQPGKFHLLDKTLQLLNPGGLYVVDDLSPLPSWEPEHAPRVSALIAKLEQKENIRITKLDWSTGILIAARIGSS